MHPDIDAWDAWPPRVLADRMAGVDVPWCVVGGWALDLCHGRPTREHADLEFALPARHFAVLPPRFPEMDFYLPQGAGRLAPLTADPPAGASHQTWAYERAAGCWRFDVFREPHDGDTWICRRDENIRLPYARIIRHTPDGIPYLTPELVLLFKAKDVRDKDRADFAATAPVLTGAQRAWLRDTLSVLHPGHEWLSRLDGG